MSTFGNSAQQTVEDTQHPVWSTRDYLLGGAAVVAFLSIAIPATLAGGGLLLFFSPVLLFFSPILVPLLLIGGTLAGGTLIAAVSAYWLYKYNTGGRPIGSAQADVVVSKSSNLYHQGADKAKNLTSQAQDRVQGLTNYAQNKANEGYGYINSKTSQAA